MHKLPRMTLRELREIERQSKVGTAIVLLAETVAASNRREGFAGVCELGYKRDRLGPSLGVQKNFRDRSIAWIPEVRHG